MGIGHDFKKKIFSKKIDLWPTYELPMSTYLFMVLVEVVGNAGIAGVLTKKNGGVNLVDGNSE